jgi:hypothetical protein
MIRQRTDKGRTFSRVSWTEDFEENKSKLLTALGYATHAHTTIAEVILDTPAGKQVFKPEPGKYVSMAYMEYCNYIIITGGLYVLDGERKLHDIRKDAARFFGPLWNEGHGGFITALMQATNITIKLKERG